MTETFEAVLDDYIHWRRHFLGEPCPDCKNKAEQGRDDKSPKRAEPSSRNIKEADR